MVTFEFLEKRRFECVYLTIPNHLADTEPHPNPSLDFS